MNCDYCGREVTSGPIVHRALGQEMAFCSGRCAEAFDRRFVDALIRMAAPDVETDGASLTPEIW